MRSRRNPKLLNLLLCFACLGAAESYAVTPPENLYQLKPGQQPPNWTLCVVSDTKTLCGYLSPIECVEVAEALEGECIRKRP